MANPTVELNQMIWAVDRAFTLTQNNFALPKKFYPAHLSVALFDAVFDSRRMHSECSVPASERYCRCVGIARTRTVRWDVPLPEDQESLTNTVARFDEFSKFRIINEIFRTERIPLHAKIAGVEHVLRAAGALRSIGIELLQDIHDQPYERVRRTLVDCTEFGDVTTRLFQMYTSDDDFVRGDDAIVKFVAEALGRTEVSAAKAQDLVRRCAYELILAPRYLYNQISRGHSVAQGMAIQGNPI